jgi:hypothetical protein
MVLHSITLTCSSGPSYWGAPSKLILKISTVRPFSTENYLKEHFHKILEPRYFLISQHYLGDINGLQFRINLRISPTYSLLKSQGLVNLELFSAERRDMALAYLPINYFCTGTHSNVSCIPRRWTRRNTAVYWYSIHSRQGILLVKEDVTNINSVRSRIILLCGCGTYPVIIHCKCRNL